MYVVLEGKCSVHVKAMGGVQGRIELAELTLGDVFGEMAALTDEPRKASCAGLGGHAMVQKISQRTINDQFLKNGDAMVSMASSRTGKRTAANSAWIRPTPMSLILLIALRQTFARLFSAG